MGERLKQAKIKKKARREKPRCQRDFDMNRAGRMFTEFISHLHAVNRTPLEKRFPAQRRLGGLVPYTFT